MLKARAGDVLLFGLSDRNLELLREGKPIRIELQDVGLEKGVVYIFHGATEADCERQLRAAGVKFPGEFDG